MKTVALVVAAGKGLRLGGQVPKQFRNVLDKPILAWTVGKFQRAEKIDEIALVVAEEFLLYANENIVNRHHLNKVSRIITGGDTRQESVRKGLLALPVSTGFVAIHDGARPLVHPDDIDRVTEKAHRERAAILARPIAETIKRVDNEFVLTTLDRSRLFLAETPQVFQYDLIMTAHQKAEDGEAVTDDSCLVEKLGFKVRTVIPRAVNHKITTEDDLELVRILLEAEYGA